jgi:hypothetical protein
MVNSPYISLLSPATGTLTATVSGVTLDIVLTISAASSLFADVTAGENSRIFRSYQTLDSGFFASTLFIDDRGGTVIAGGVSYPKGWYTSEADLTSIEPYSGDIEADSAGTYIFEQNAIDAGFRTCIHKRIVL